MTARRTKAAIVWEGEPGDTRTLTYFELHRQVVRLSAALLDLGVKPGDRIAIYMGMVPEAAVAMLACARIGAVHSVVFGGFSADALRDRINDCGAKVLLTQDGAWRRGNVVPLKSMADKAIEQTPTIERTVVLRRVGTPLLGDSAFSMKEGRDVWWEDLLGRPPSAASLARAKAPEAFDAEHPLFILYTSGSTGKPKGVLHTTAGYLAGTHVTTKYVFDVREEDTYWCTADVGWVTGHSYIVYGPLSCGATCLMYEGAPNYPDWGRFWSIVERHGVNVLYTAPTAIRAFIRAGDEVAEEARSVESAPSGERQGADQSGGLDVVPPRHWRRTMSGGGHVVANRNRCHHADDVAGRRLLEARRDGASFLRCRHCGREGSRRAVWTE